MRAQRSLACVLHYSPGTALPVPTVSPVATASQGIHVTALREIKILRELRSPRVVNLVDVFISKERNLALVLEYMESDLEAVVKDTSLVLSRADVKAYMQMALQGLAACHTHNVMHRDIKPNNLLISPTGARPAENMGFHSTAGRFCLHVLGPSCLAMSRAARHERAQCYCLCRCAFDALCLCVCSLSMRVAPVSSHALSRFVHYSVCSITDVQCKRAWRLHHDTVLRRCCR